MQERDYRSQCTWVKCWFRNKIGLEKTIDWDWEYPKEEKKIIKFNKTGMLVLHLETKNKILPKSKCLCPPNVRHKQMWEIWPKILSEHYIVYFTDIWMR